MTFLGNWDHRPIRYSARGFVTCLVFWLDTNLLSAGYWKLATSLSVKSVSDSLPCFLIMTHSISTFTVCRKQIEFYYIRSLGNLFISFVPTNNHYVSSITYRPHIMSNRQCILKIRKNSTHMYLDTQQRHFPSLQLNTNENCNAFWKYPPSYL